MGRVAARRLPGACLMAIAVVALGTAAAADEIEVRDAWIRQPPPGANAAAYLTIENRSEVARNLTGVRSDAAERIELHRTVVEGGVARMEPVESIEIPAGGRLVLEPRALHLMLIQPGPLADGDEVSLTLVLDDDELVGAQVPVRREPPGGDGAEHGAHEQHGH